MIKVCVYREGAVAHQDVDLDEISEIIKRPDNLVWLDIGRPDVHDLDLLEREFGFHPLALEDATRAHQRAKVDMYEDYFFLIFYALLMPEQQDDMRIVPVQVSFFVGKNFIVSIHQRPSTALEEISQRWQDSARDVGQHSLGLLLYSILDTICDGYFPVIDALSDRIEALEERIFDAYDVTAQQEIFQVKKDLLVLRRAISPERDVMNVLVRRDTPIFDAATIIYLQDVYDHILRITDTVDTYRDLLSGALDAYLSVTSNRLNRVMKTLTASSIILMSMTLVASIYGMNFIHIPELQWHYGYAWALGLMAAIGISLMALFRRIDWI